MLTFVLFSIRGRALLHPQSIEWLLALDLSPFLFQLEPIPLTALSSGEELAEWANFPQVPPEPLVHAYYGFEKALQQLLVHSEGLR